LTAIIELVPFLHSSWRESPVGKTEQSPGTWANVLIECTEGCHLRYHCDRMDTEDCEKDCWNIVFLQYHNINGIIEYGKPCINKDCKGTIVTVDRFIGFRKSDETTVATNKNDHEITDDNDAKIDLNQFDSPPTAYELFEKEFFATEENKKCNQPRKIESTWTALSRKKKNRYEDRARILQLHWIHQKKR